MFAFTPYEKANIWCGPHTLGQRWLTKLMQLDSTWFEKHICLYLSQSNEKTG
jgi:hypothetical protein